MTRLCLLLWFLLCLLLVAACSSQPAQSAALPSDATFVRDDVPACLQQYPDYAERGYPCCQVLAFYRDGEVARTSGEEGFPGRYTLDGPVARGTLFGEDFVFDFGTGTATGASLAAGTWLADTEQLSAIACHP